MTTIIKQDDLITSVKDALQFISYYHPQDFIQAMSRAYDREENQAAKDAIAQILINSRMCAEGHRPICQDTGIVNVFLEVGLDVKFDLTMSLDDAINEGVRQGYLENTNVLRASVLADPAFGRKNTKDNTPAVIHYKLVPGNKVDITVAAKGGGSENKSKLAMLNPSDSIVDWVLKTVPTMGAGWCPPGMLGIGIFEKVNALGIGAQGLGGLTTVLDIKIKDYPCHAAGKPVGMIPNCAATRHAHFTLDGSGVVHIQAPSLEDYPAVTWDSSTSKRVDLDHITQEEMNSWKPGDTLLLNGTIYTGRDAAHKRMVDMLNNGEELPVDLKGKFIYYVGPVDPVGDEVVGPAGPTTATRMDKFTRQVLEATGLYGMIGKADRGPAAVEAIKDNKATYLMAVGGAAYLVSKAIREAEVVAFEDLGMEAIYKFVVKDMPVSVAVDVNGTSVHATAPKIWQAKIGKIPVVDAAAV